MVKKVSYFIYLIIGTFYGQVGIGTTSPETDLHVNGSMLVTDEFQIGALGTVNGTDENFKLLTRVSNSVPAGEITVLDVDSLTVAPINVVNYTFENLDKDNLTDLDLGYDTSKYIVGISNFQYIGNSVRKQTGSANNSIGTFVTRTFESGGTWHIEIRNRFLDNLAGSVSYKVTLVVYDKSFYKLLPPIHTNLGGNNSGPASSVPNLVN